MKQGISSPNQLMMMDDSSHASSVDQSHVITAMEELKTPFASWEDENNNENSAQVDDATVYENASTDSSEVEEASLCSKMHSSSSSSSQPAAAIVKKNNNELQESTHSYSQYPVISLSESQHSIVSGLTQMNFSHHDNLKHSSHHGGNNGNNNKKKKVDPKDDEIARLRQELFLLKQNVMKEGEISKDELVSCLDRIHEELGGGSNEINKLEYGSEGDSSMADSDLEGENASSTRRRKKSRSAERKKKDRSGSRPKRKKVRSPMRATTTTEQDSSSKTSTTTSSVNNNNKTPKRRGSNGSSRRKYRGTVKSNSSERSRSSPIDNEDLRKILKGDSSYLRMASLKEEQKEEQSISTRSTKSSTRSMGRSSSVGALHKKEHSTSTRSSSVGPLKEQQDATTSTRNSLLLQEVKEEDSKHLRSASVGPDTSSRHLREVVKEEDYSSSKHKRSSSMGPDTSSSRHMRSLDNVVGPSPTNTKDPFLPKPAMTRKEKEARRSDIHHLFDLNDDTVGKRKKAPRRKSAPMNVTDFDAFLLRQAAKEAEQEEAKQELQLNDVPLKRRERGNFQKKAIRRQSAPMLFSTDFPLNLHLQQASLNHLSLDDDDDDSKDESKENTKSTASKSVASKSFGDDEETTKTTASKSLDEEEETSKELTIASSDAKDAGSVKKKKKKKIIKNPNRRSSMSAVMTDLSGGITEMDLAADDSSAASSTRRRKKGTARKPKNKRASMEAIPMEEMMTMKPSVEKNRRRASMDLVPSKLVRQTTDSNDLLVTSSNDLLPKPTALTRQTTFDQVVSRYATDETPSAAAATSTSKKSRTPRRASISDFTFVSEHSLVVEDDDDKKKKKSSKKKKDPTSQDAKVMEAFSASFAGFPLLQGDEEEPSVVAAVKRSKMQQAKRKSTKFLSKLADTAAIMSPRSKEKRKINLFGGDKSSLHSSFAA